MKIWEILPLLLLGTAIFAQAGVDDSAYWIHVGVKHKLDETHGIKISTEHRLNDDGDNYSSNNLDVGYISKLNAIWSYSINMRIEGKKKRDGGWKEEWRPNFNVTAKKGVGPLTFSNRSRIEWRILEGTSDLARFRNKAEIAYAIPSAPYGLSPFIADEQFVDSRHGEFNQNRAFGGMKFKIDRWSTKIFAFDKAVKKGDDWRHSLVYGLTLYTAF